MMSFVRYAFVIWTCFLVIVGSQNPIEDTISLDLEAENEGGMLVYSVGSKIRLFRIFNEEIETIINDVKFRPVGVAMSASELDVYWSNINVGEKTIMHGFTYDLNSTAIVDTGLVAPEKLAIDWVTGNIYFIDKDKKHIGVCTETGLYCTIILNSTLLDTPGGLVLNPEKSEMFWSDYGKTPSIWRAGMDGNEAKTIVTKDLSRPKCLAIDYPEKRLYWFDSKLKRIESISLNGTDRKLLSEMGDSRLHSLAILGDTLYWSDWNTNTIESMNIAKSDNRRTIIHESELIMDMEIYQFSLKLPFPNPCKNHNCSELCLSALGGKHTCACKLGNVLSSDSHTCSRTNESPHLVIAAVDRIIHYHEQILGKTRIEEIFMPIRMSRIVYDRSTGNLLADDQFTNALYSLDSVDNEIRRITSVGSMLSDIDVDYKNNIISWSVPDLRRIGQINLNNGTKWHYTFKDVPLKILSFPEYEIICVLFKYDTSKQCSKQGYLACLDLAFSSTPPTKIWEIGLNASFAYDERSKRLYVADEDSGIIQSVSLRNIINITLPSDTDAQVLRLNVGKPVSLAILNDKVFWTNRDSNVLQWMDLNDEYREIKSKILPIKEHLGILDLAVVGNKR